MLTKGRFSRTLALVLCLQLLLIGFVQTGAVYAAEQTESGAASEEKETFVNPASTTDVFEEDVKETTSEKENDAVQETRETEEASQPPEPENLKESEDTGETDTAQPAETVPDEAEKKESEPEKELEVESNKETDSAGEVLLSRFIKRGRRTMPIKVSFRPETDSPVIL